MHLFVRHKFEPVIFRHLSIKLDVNLFIDIVYIGAIHPCHFTLCKQAIHAGKHVVCEKPMTMNEWQAKEVLDLVKEKGVFFLEVKNLIKVINRILSIL